MMFVAALAKMRAPREHPWATRAVRISMFNVDFGWNRTTIECHEPWLQYEQHGLHCNSFDLFASPITLA